MTIKQFFKNPQYDSLKTVGLIVVVGFLGVFLYTHNFFRIDQTGRALHCTPTASSFVGNDGVARCDVTNSNCTHTITYPGPNGCSTIITQPTTGTSTKNTTGSPTPDDGHGIVNDGKN